MRQGQVQRLAREMREEQLLQNIRDRARVLGLLECHHRNSRAATSGFPDLVLVGSRVAFRELKRETGRLSAAQQTWLGCLQAAGADADVWRPSDLLSGRVDRELRQLAQQAHTEHTARSKQ